ncbi:MAG: hypothetical protein MSA56_03125 [Clostridium sp.]|nr:hypothetical protein [Clostridium sp.]
MADVDKYTKTYSTFGGSDIVCSFDDVVIGECQAITYSITREKVAVYTLGSAEPRSFSRGKRGIAGNLVFIVFNRDALLSSLGDRKITKYKGNDVVTMLNEYDTRFLSMDKWDDYMTNAALDSAGQPDEYTNALVNDQAQPVYADELLPFDITISCANEYGQRAVTVIYGVEILNEGVGFSIDSPTSERAYTFVARAVDSMVPVAGDTENRIWTSW